MTETRPIATEANRLLVGNPENRRARFYQEALQSLGLEPAREVSYASLLHDWRSAAATGALDATLANHLGDAELIRVESPGESFDVERHLIAIGADQTNNAEISAEEALQLEFDLGRLRYTRSWYAGFRAVMSALRRATSGRRCYNDPEDILVLFDKPRCQALLESRGVPTPPRLEQVHNYQTLRERVQQAGWNRVFVKLAHGSSASGAIAIHFHSGGTRAWSTVETVGAGPDQKHYNNLTLQTYSGDEEIGALTNAIFAQGAHAEQWLPKARRGGREFDFRVLVVHGEPCHVVARASRGPMTNLPPWQPTSGHRRACRGGGAGALRGRVVDCGGSGGDLSRFAPPGRRYPGQPPIPRSTSPRGNAFGDLLPGVEWRGCNTYAWEILHEASVTSQAAGDAM